jgi:hypothetical protein
VNVYGKNYLHHLNLYGSLCMNNYLANTGHDNKMDEHQSRLNLVLVLQNENNWSGQIKTQYKQIKR